MPFVSAGAPSNSSKEKELLYLSGAFIFANNSYYPEKYSTSLFLLTLFKNSKKIEGPKRIKNRLLKTVSKISSFYASSSALRKPTKSKTKEKMKDWLRIRQS